MLITATILTFLVGAFYLALAFFGKIFPLPIILTILLFTGEIVFLIR